MRYYIDFGEGFTDYKIKTGSGILKFDSRYNFIDREVWSQIPMKIQYFAHEIFYMENGIPIFVKHRGKEFYDDETLTYILISAERIT